MLKYAIKSKITTPILLRPQATIEISPNTGMAHTTGDNTNIADTIETKRLIIAEIASFVPKNTADPVY